MAWTLGPSPSLSHHSLQIKQAGGLEAGGTDKKTTLLCVVDWEYLPPRHSGTWKVPLCPELIHSPRQGSCMDNELPR